MVDGNKKAAEDFAATEAQVASNTAGPTAEKQAEDARLVTLNAKVDDLTRQLRMGGYPALALHGDKRQSVALLQQTVELHMETVEELEVGYEFFTTLDPDLLVQIAKGFLQHCPTEPIPAGEDQDPTLDKAIGVLEIVLTHVPGMIEAQLLLAKTKYITNDLEGAQRQIQQCLQLNPSYSEANVILAQVFLAQDQYQDALGALDQALAHNFEISDTPLYAIIKAKVLESAGEVQDACDTLQAALELPGIRGSGSKGVGMHERASVFVQLSQVLLKLNKADDAQKVITEAKGMFMGTPEEMAVMIVIELWW